MGLYDDYKLQASDYTDKDIASLPDVVSGQASTLKARFDSLVKDVVAARFNSLLQALDGKLLTHPLVCNKSISSDQAISASTVKKLLSQTGLSSGGVYLVTCTATFTASTSPGSGGADIYLGLYGGDSATAPAYRQNVHVTSTARKDVGFSRIMTGLTAMAMNFYSTVAGKVTAGELRIVRLA